MGGNEIFQLVLVGDGESVAFRLVNFGEEEEEEVPVLDQVKNQLTPLYVIYIIYIYIYRLILLPSHLEFRECTDIMLVATKRHKPAEKEHTVSSMTAI